MIGQVFILQGRLYRIHTSYTNGIFTFYNLEEIEDNGSYKIIARKSHDGVITYFDDKAESLFLKPRVELKNHNGHSAGSTHSLHTYFKNYSN